MSRDKVIFSPSNKAFYLVFSSIRKLPEDCIVICKKKYDEIQTELVNYDERFDTVLGSDDDGNPVVIYNEKESPFTKSNIRKARNMILRETDWSQLDDIPDAIKKAYKKYRQDLRDIPLQEGFPKEVNWPEPPEVNK